MKRSTYWLVVLLIGIGMMPAVQAQDSTRADKALSLGLEEALEKVSSSGFEVRIAEKGQEAARAGLSQANAVFLPQLTVEESAVKTNDPIGVFGIKLRQGIIQASDFDPSLLNDPDATHDFTTRVQIRQPILNPEGWFQRSAAKFKAQAAADQLNATKAYARFKVKEVYYRLGIMDEQISVLKQHLATASSFAKQASDYFEQGLIAKSAFLNARVSVLDAEKKLLKAENQRESVNDELLLLLGITDEYRIHTTDHPNTEDPLPVSLSDNDAVNATVLAIQHQKDANAAMLKAARSSFLPSLNVFGTYELHDSKLFGNQGDHYMIGASLKWDLFKGFKQIGKVNQRKAEYKQAELQYQQKILSHRKEVNKAIRTIEESLKNIELSELSIEQSEEEVRYRSDRYEQGLEKTSDLLLSETKNLKNKLSRLEALYQYEMAQAALEYLQSAENQ